MRIIRSIVLVAVTIAGTLGVEYYLKPQAIGVIADVTEIESVEDVRVCVKKQGLGALMFGLDENGDPATAYKPVCIVKQ